MKHRNDRGRPRRGPGHTEHPHDRGHYASRQYEDVGYEAKNAFDFFGRSNAFATGVRQQQRPRDAAPAYALGNV